MTGTVSYRPLSNKIDGFKSSVSQKEVCEMKAKYDAGECSKEDYASFLCNIMKFWIINRLKTTGRLNGAEFEDLVQSGYLAVIEHIDEYDPTKTKPTTFFSNHIDEFQRKQTKSASTQYYNAKMNEINKVLKKRGYSDMFDPRLTPDTIAIITDKHLSTVINTMKMAQNTICGGDILETTDVEGCMYDNPETAYINNEISTELEAVIQRLNSPLKKFIIYDFLENGQRSARQYVQMLKDTELGKNFEETKQPNFNSDYIENLINNTMADMRGFIENKPRVAILDDSTVEYDYEQADFVDLDIAINEGLLD